MEKKVFRVILVLVVVLLCGYFLFGVVPSALFDSDYTVEAVEDCVYNDTVSVEGVALRTETVLVAGSDCATMVHNVSDGERVAVGTSVATVSNKAFSDEAFIRNEVAYYRGLTAYTEGYERSFKYQASAALSVNGYCLSVIGVEVYIDIGFAVIVKSCHNLENAFIGENSYFII